LINIFQRPLTPQLGQAQFSCPERQLTYSLGAFGEKFDQQGELHDAQTEQLIRDFWQAFIRFEHSNEH
jgi:hypothetical protein